jgi:hypothetical protein
VIGYFLISDYPSCPIVGIRPNRTNYNHASAISIDGEALHYASQQHFLVVPTKGASGKHLGR